MRRNVGRVRAVVFCAAALTGLIFAGSALGVTITSFTPTSGLPNKDNGTTCPGATVTITGIGFVNDNPDVALAVPQTTVRVTFGGTPSPLVLVGSDKTIFAVVPDGATDGPIVVTTAAGSDSSAGKKVTNTVDGNFYVNPCTQVSLKAATAGATDTSSQSTPTIYKVKPYKGKVGTAVTITGTGLLRVSGVTFGGVKAKFTQTGPTQITATVPARAKTGKIGLTYLLTAGTTQNPGGGVAPKNDVGNSSSTTSIQYSPKAFVVG